MDSDRAEEVIHHHLKNMREPPDILRNGKVNVLFVMMQMAMGGSERLIHNLVLHLDRDRYSPHVAWFFGESVLREFRDLDVPLYYVPKVKRFDISTMRLMAGIIRDNDIHVVNAHHFMSMVYTFYGCKMKNNVKLIYTEHSQWEIEKISWKWKQIGMRLLARADGVVGVTHEVSDMLRSRFRLEGDKCFTIQNGVDIERFERKNRREAIRKEMGLKIDEMVIGVVANFKRIKNHIFLLRAYLSLFQKGKHAKLLLVGRGFDDDPDNTEREMREFVSEKGLSDHVLFLGYRSDIPDLLNAMDVFCLTSLKEGMPISLIEAMAVGLPVVGTNVEGIRGIIKQNRNGYLVEIDDAIALSNALERVLDDSVLRATMGQESRLLALSQHKLSICLEKYQDIFSS